MTPLSRLGKFGEKQTNIKKQEEGLVDVEIVENSSDKRLKFGKTGFIDIFSELV